MDPAHPLRLRIDADDCLQGGSHEGMGAHLSPEDRVLLHELRRRTDNEIAATLSASSHRLRRRDSDNKDVKAALRMIAEV